MLKEIMNWPIVKYIVGGICSLNLTALMISLVEKDYDTIHAVLWLDLFILLAYLFGNSIDHIKTKFGSKK